MHPLIDLYTTYSQMQQCSDYFFLRSLLILYSFIKFITFYLCASRCFSRHVAFIRQFLSNRAASLSLLQTHFCHICVYSIHKESTCGLYCNSVNKANTFNPSATTTCEFVLAQPSTTPKQSPLPNSGFTRSMVFRHLAMLLHAEIATHGIGNSKKSPSLKK